MTICAHCDQRVEHVLDHYHDDLGCWRCPPSKLYVDVVMQQKEEKERASLLTWFASCPFDAYQTGALQAAYKALTEWED